VPEPAAEGSPPAVRPPRKRFIFIGLGIGLLIILIVGLTTTVGTNPSTPPAPKAGSALPSFSKPNVGPTGGSQVSVPGSGAGSGTPVVLLFFGNWCPSCHSELPPLTAAVRAQAKAGGALARIRVIGVDSEDTTGKAKSFIAAAGVTFPVAYDADAGVLSGLFYFRGDPNAVFVNGDGTINKIVQGDTLTPLSFTADERALLAKKST
jgi:cytochrome c biogenesis protein CcmG/thiol:disulfide interchange protein DsbE